MVAGAVVTRFQRSAYLDAAGELTIRESVALAPVAPGNVLIKTLVSALCGSDLHRFRGATSYGIDTDVFGHETVGTVVDATSGALTGDRVLALPYPAEGRVFADYQSVPLATMIPVPEALESTIAVFGQQLGTVIFALRRFLRASGIHDGGVPDRVAVVGSGPAGVLFVKVLRMLGCPVVAVLEPIAYRRELALRNGATLLDGEPYSLVIDTTGDLAGREACLENVANGGVIGIFGLPDDEPGGLGVDVLTILGRNLTITGAMGAQGEPGLRSFREAIDMLADGRIDVSDLVSHTGDLDDLPRLSQIAAHQTEDVSKVLITFPSEEIS
jgi:L-iditol 2-dehydrogenase